MSLQKSFSRDPFLFSQERNKSYRKVTSCVDGVIALASTVSHLRSGYDALGKGTPALRAQNQASIVLHSTAALTNCAVFLCCTQFQNIHQYNRHARNAVRANYNYYNRGRPCQLQLLQPCRKARHTIHS